MMMGRTFVVLLALLSCVSAVDVVNEHKEAADTDVHATNTEKSHTSVSETEAATTRAIMSEASAALNKIIAFTDSSGKLYDYSFAEVRSGDEAHDIFCKCEPNPALGKGLWEMCPGITEQCKRSFCKPLCLRMAWHPTIKVDCSKAPGWKWCPKFKAQIHVAAKALIAQFQAHTCLDLHFCNETHHMNQWIENHSYGQQYPNPHLPIRSCNHPKGKISEEQEEMLCKACESVLDVDIERGDCLPQFKTLQPGSLQERCMYLADVIGNRKAFLLRVFKERVCSCLGCCGSGKCFFQNPEENWLNVLVDSVQTRVTAELEEEGWTILHNRDIPEAARAERNRQQKQNKQF